MAEAGGLQRKPPGGDAGQRQEKVKKHLMRRKRKRRGRVLIGWFTRRRDRNVLLRTSSTRFRWQKEPTEPQIIESLIQFRSVYGRSRSGPDSVREEIQQPQLLPSTLWFMRKHLQISNMAVMNRTKSKNIIPVTLPRLHRSFPSLLNDVQEKPIRDALQPPSNSAPFIHLLLLPQQSLSHLMAFDLVFHPPPHSDRCSVSGGVAAPGLDCDIGLLETCHVDLQRETTSQHMEGYRGGDKGGEREGGRQNQTITVNSKQMQQETDEKGLKRQTMDRHGDVSFLPVKQEVSPERIMSCNCPVLQTKTH